VASARTIFCGASHAPRTKPVSDYYFKIQAPFIYSLKNYVFT